MSWYLKVIKEYAVFSGRARRKEYWTFTLINLLLHFSAIVLTIMLSDPVFLFLHGIYGFATLVPSLAVTVRRLHDINYSGWYILISLVPMIGGILLLDALCKRGYYGTNRYGRNPMGE